MISLDLNRNISAYRAWFRFRIHHDFVRVKYDPEFRKKYNAKRTPATLEFDTDEDAIRFILEWS